MKGRNAIRCLKELEAWFRSQEYMPEINDEGLKSAIYIFANVMKERIWQKADKDNEPYKVRKRRVDDFGTELRYLIREYTDIDTFELCKDDKK